MFIVNRPLRFFQLRQERHGEPEVDAAPNGAQRAQWEVLFYKHFAPSGASGYPLSPLGEIAIVLETQAGYGILLKSSIIEVISFQRSARCGPPCRSHVCESQLPVQLPADFD